MNTGAFGEGFPYSNFHDLNMDWIIKIAKDFLDQYSHIQETIQTGLDDLDAKTTELEGLLQDWYDTHSDDIANQLADALEDLNTWYTEHSADINNELQNAIIDFNQSANQKTAECIASIPDDYTALSQRVDGLQNQFNDQIGIINPVNILPNPLFISNFEDDWSTNVASYEIVKLSDSAGYGVRPVADSGVVRINTYIPLSAVTADTTYKIKCHKNPSVNGRCVLFEADENKTTTNVFFNGTTTSDDYDYSVTMPAEFRQDTEYIGIQITNTSGGIATTFSLPMLYKGDTDENFFTPYYYETYNSELAKIIPSLVNVNNLMPNPLFFNGMLNEWETNSSNYSIVEIANGGYGVNTGTSQNALRLVIALPVSKFKTGTTYRVKCRKTNHIIGRVVVLEADNSKTPISYILNSDPTSSDFDVTFTTPSAFDNSTEYIIIQFTNTSGGLATTFYEPALYEGITDQDFFSNLYRQLGTPEDEKLYNKKICLAGDSICAGISYNGAYGTLLSEKCGMIVQNVAVHGACISNVPDHAHITELIENLDTDGDFYIYEGGFNDSGNSVQLGENTYSDVIETTMTYNMSIYRDAFEYLCRNLVINHKTKKIGFIFPHKITNRELGNWGNFKALSIKLLEKYGIPYLDLAKVSGMDTALTELAQYTNNSDGVHPTMEGYEKFYFSKIASWLRSL